MLIIFDLDDTLYDRTGQLPENHTQKQVQAIELFSGVKELLNVSGFSKILVTKGESEFQQKKLELLGIKDKFDEIKITSTDEEKKKEFEDILDRCPHPLTWVIGNRIDSEIRYGNELGLKTIHLKHGKYKHLKARDRFEIPDYETEHFIGVLGIIFDGSNGWNGE